MPNIEVANTYSAQNSSPINLRKDNIHGIACSMHMGTVGVTNLPMGPGMIMFSINGQYPLGKLKFLARRNSSQFLSSPSSMMPIDICH